MAHTQVTLHDYYVLVPEAIRALEAREAALAALHSLQDDAAHKQHQLEQALGAKVCVTVWLCLCVAACVAVLAAPWVVFRGW